MFNKYYDDYQIGDTWNSRGRTITEADIVNFASLSGDWFPLHTDIEYAKDTPFQKRIAHGMLVLSIATGLVELKPGIVVAFYGMDKIRFTNPTFINDTVSLEMKVTDKIDKGETAGVIVAKLVVKKQTGENVIVGGMSMLMNKQEG
ncbi:MaoC/PaaZ C-terminal domain-containing protein [Lentibacillus sp. L22]|uniref:MaoC/PaaZ C-terminal domain-containing protein n=1 Tax=Lentibacillus TaxID=175304 RepID=UPI0022B15C6A|nr:MaoC/PaaZ C-terminal domain-containing protein [Lentibacillus daqui]